MTDLRDARLHRALRSAPDGDAMPSAATRRSIRDAAHAAVRPAPRKWLAWWPDAGQRMPWNAAFATVLLGVLVGVLWRGEEVPDAVTDAARLDRAIPPVAAPAPVAPDAPVAAPPGAVPIPPQPAPAQAARPPSPVRTAPPAKAEAPVTQDRTMADAERSLAKAAAQDTARRDAPASLARDHAAAEVRRPVDAVAAAAPAAAPPPPVAATARAPMPAPELAPAPAAAPAPRSAPRAGFSEGAAQLRAQPVAPWSLLRIAVDGRTVLVDRLQAGRLASLIDQVVAAPVASDAWEGGAAVQLEWSHDDQRLGQLEATTRQARWTAPSGVVRVLQPDPALLQAVRDEALLRVR